MSAEARDSRSGRLLVCATPIGNLGDVTLRVLEALAECDVIMAEDTRVTRKLLSRYDIHTRCESFNANDAERKTPKVLARIEGGETVALVSDAGTPGISDPGALLVDAALERGLAVEVLPGPSAIITALVASGLPTGSFYFGGFLPRKPGACRRALGAVAGLEATLVFYESPRRAAATAELVAEVLPGRRAAVARELTKVHEEVIRGTTEEIAAILADRDEIKGEVVLLIGPPAGSPEDLDDAVIARRVQGHMRLGMSRRDAAAETAKEMGISRNRAYEASLKAPPTLDA
ncbi:MAG: 16S rRNA (cytidine(1402)-2'-O)-methyltransferase [Coriobacteriia bacterium]